MGGPPATPPHMVERPVFDPDRSLGWRSGPLDGLSCLLRCLEAVLRAQGFDQLATARAMACPLDLTGSRRPSWRFRAGRLDWHNAVDGRDHWGELSALVAAGIPVILMPDRYYWPGDEFQGRQHFLDHMVLVLSVDDDELGVLDTDAPPEGNYERRVGLTPDVIQGACRFATAHFGPPMDTPDTLAATLLAPTAHWLTDDRGALAGLTRRWRRDGLTGPLARALHVILLGEVQPQLFLAALSVADTYPQAAASAATAAEAAQALGMLLLGTHRYAGTEPDDTAIYGVALSRFGQLADALCSYADVLHAELGLRPVAPAHWVEPDERLWDRVNRMQAWCFADSVAAPNGQEGTPHDQS